MRSKFFSYPIVSYDKTEDQKQNLNTPFYRLFINKLTGGIGKLITMYLITF